jgi:O-antigen/teichoic acid export membrane protein
VLLKHVLPTLRIVPFTRDTVGELVRFSAQIFVLRINAVVYNQMDKVIIGVFLVSTLLTDYDIANKVRAMVLAVISSVSVLAVPAASYLEARDDHDRLRSLFYQGTKYTLMIALPSVVSILILSPSLITLWVGAEYSYLVGLVRLTVIYLSWFPLVVTGYNMLIGTGQIKPLLVVQTITTLINLLVSIWLTPPLGVAGVMWGTLVGNLLAFGPYMVILGRTFAVQWGEFVRTVIVPVYASAIVFGTVLLLAVRLWGQPQTFWQLAWLGGVSGGIYVVGLFVLGTSASERKALLEIIAGRLAHQ